MQFKKKDKENKPRVICKRLLGILFDLQLTLHLGCYRLVLVCVCVILTVRGMLMYCACKGLLGCVWCV